jgi:hypothetical protein
MHQALQCIGIIHDVNARVVEVDLPVGQHHLEELNLECSFIIWERVICSWKLGHELVQMAGVDGCTVLLGLRQLFF